MRSRTHHLARRQDGRIFAGVATGVGDALGVDANVVRCGFLVLALAGGIGVLLYGAGWLLLPAAGADAPALRRSDAISTGAFAAVVLGVLILVRTVGLWPGDVIVWPLGAALVGLALLSTRPHDDDTLAPPDWPILDRLPPEAADAAAVLFGTRRGTLARIVAGTACIAVGLGAFFVSVDSWRALQGGVVGAAVVLVGFALILGPGLWALVNQLVAERRERIRSDERADVAAHLHDSVLQTLALVQRRADDPREVVRLARMQERELRTWLLSGDQAGRVDGSLGVALDELAAEIEAEHGVPVEVVRVRDCPAAGLQPLLLAAREAIVNAARHSGASRVSVYLEVEPQRVSIFVRDTGHGFDPSAVADDRRGISGSIVDRLARAGGAGAVRTARGEGTEVEMSLPRPSEEATS